MTELNQLIKDNRVAEYSSPNLILGMRPIAFGPRCQALRLSLAQGLTVGLVGEVNSPLS